MKSRLKSRLACAMHHSLDGHGALAFNSTPVLSLIITDKGGSQRRMDFEGAHLKIGRLEDNDVVLPKTNVSKYHARLTHQDGRFVVTDQQSTNGTFVNGRRITGPTAVRPGDKVYIGDFILGMASGQSEPASPPTTAPKTSPTRDIKRNSVLPDGPTRNFPVPRSEPPATTAPARSMSLAPPPVPPTRRVAKQGSSTSPMPTEAAALRPATIPVTARDDRPELSEAGLTSPAILAPSVRLQGALCTLMEQLAAQLVLQDGHPVQEGAFTAEQNKILDGLIDGLAQDGVIGPDLDRRYLRDAAVSEAVGLGPLDRLMNNNSAREVVVDGPDRILADLGGGLAPVSAFFSSTAAVTSTAQRLLARARPTGVTPGPVQEATLPDGSHVTVLTPPLTPRGPVISIRFANKMTVAPESMVTEGVLSMDMLEVLRGAIRARLNIVVSGARGVGVSGIVSAIAGLCPSHERVVSIERRPGLAIDHPQHICLARHAVSGLSCDDALEHAARLRCDRLVLDEVKAEDVLTVLTAASCEQGMIVGLRAASAQAALEQLERLSTIAGGPTARTVAPLLAQAVQLVVHLHCDREGSRRIETIAEIAQTETGQVHLRPLFGYDGGFQASGHRPSFQSG